MKKIMTLTAFAFIAFMTSKAHAQPTCQTLGYTQSASDCSGKQKVACPTDESKFFCGESDKKTCESLNYVSTVANDKKCSYIQVSGLSSGSGCYTNCYDAPACSTGVGKGSTGANAKIALISNNSDGTCTYRTAGNCNYAGHGPSATRLSESNFGNLLKYFPSDFKIYDVGDRNCGTSMTGTKIESGKICIAWNQPTYGSTCSQAGASSTTANGKTVCYKCVTNSSSNASSIAGYVCYQAGSVVTSLTSNKEMCTTTETVTRNSL